MFPLGAVVPLMNEYRYADLADVVAACKRGLGEVGPVHLFGAGHPMMFAMAAALGCDLFDSAAYALYARDDRYLTVQGTELLDELSYFPCHCPVCTATRRRNSMRWTPTHASNCSPDTTSTSPTAKSGRSSKRFARATSWNWSTAAPWSPGDARRLPRLARPLRATRTHRPGLEGRVLLPSTESARRPEADAHQDRRSASRSRARKCADRRHSSAQYDESWVVLTRSVRTCANSLTPIR